MRKKHPFEVHKRAFVIWQKLGFNPWEKPKKRKKKKVIKNSSGDFYKGAFDGIPFLNDDSKRTFKHIFFRPGYMIRDYVNGEHERYLAPLTSLIVFFAFFALISSLLQPLQQKKKLPFEDMLATIDRQGVSEELFSQVVTNTLRIVKSTYLYMHLDEYPEEVKTQREASLAALEANLRNQGIPLFVSKFFILWFAMSLALRRYRVGMPACAAATAYILCQFCFFMMFAVLASFGTSTSISVALMLLLLMIDYHQWLGISIKKSIKLSIKTGIDYLLVYGAALVLATLIIVGIAYFKSI